MRKLIRHKHFDATIELTDDNFIAPPHESQRNWLINRAVKEFGWDLEALDRLANRFVPGQADTIGLQAQSRDNPDALPDDIMEMWQLPIMQRMAHRVTRAKGDVLEIGYGRGVSAKMIQDLGAQTHTIVECVPKIADDCRQWAQTLDQNNVAVIEDRWETAVDQFTAYDGIFFHTYPMDSEEYAHAARNQANVAEPFFPVAAHHLKQGGTFCYYSNEMDSLGRSHQRALLQHFDSFSVECLKDLPIPQDVKDTWWIDQMMIVCAHRN